MVDGGWSGRREWRVVFIVTNTVNLKIGNVWYSAPHLRISVLQYNTLHARTTIICCETAHNTWMMDQLRVSDRSRADRISREILLVEGVW